MAEECGDPTTKLPKAISLCVPVGGIAGLFFIIPICATMPALEDILAAPVGQALPYIFGVVMDSPGGGLGLTFLVLVITLFCSISITVAASRCTWAFARDKALPLSRLWSKVDVRHGTPIWALTLVSGFRSRDMQEERSSRRNLTVNEPSRADSATTDYSRANATWADQSRIIVSFPGVRFSWSDIIGRVVRDPHRYLTLPPPQRRQWRTVDYGEHRRLGCQHHRPSVDCV